MYPNKYLMKKYGSKYKPRVFNPIRLHDPREEWYWDGGVDNGEKALEREYELGKR